jgi:uncharacterized protein
MSDTAATPAPTSTAAGFPVTWFEIGTTDPGAATAFYGEVFGWTFNPEGPYTMITTGPDHTVGGGVNDTSGPVQDGTPTTYAIFYVQVDDVAASCVAVEEAGGKVIVGATTTPDGITFAHVADPAGSHFGLWTPPSAA